MIPDVVAIQFRAMECEVLPFRPPVEMEVLGHVANIGSRNEAGIGMEVGSDVLILQFIGEAPPKTVEHAFMILAEGITDSRRSNRTACASRSIQRGDNRTGGVSGRDHTAKP